MAQQIEGKDIDNDKVKKIGEELNKIFQEKWDDVKVLAKKYEDTVPEFGLAMNFTLANFIYNLTPEPINLCITIAHNIIQFESDPANKDIKKWDKEERPSYFG